MQYAIVDNGELVEIREFAEAPKPLPGKSYRQFLPVVREYGTPFKGVEGGKWVIRTVDPATLPPPVPEYVTPRQCRLALLAAGRLDAANAVVSQADAATKIAWEFASGVYRNDPGVIQFAAAIGIKDGAELDALFIEAAKL